MTETKNNTTTEAKDISFNPQAFEPKWQKKWEADKLYRSVIDESRPKHYALRMRARVSSACRATTCYSRWALTRSV
jgi:hypothetical protein